MVDYPEYILTLNQYAQAWKLAKILNDRNHTKEGWFTNQEKLRNDLAGAMAEIVVSLEIGVPANMISYETGGDPGYDFKWRGYLLDSKGSTHKAESTNLLIRADQFDKPVPEGYQARQLIYVQAAVPKPENSRRVQIVGVMSKALFAKKKTWREFNTSNRIPCWQVSRDELYPWRRFLFDVRNSRS